MTVPSRLLAVLLLAAPLLAVPLAALAQTAAAPSATGPSATGRPEATTAEQMLKVATVKLTDGWRASKLIGAPVFDEHNTQVGSIDDLILTREDKVMVAIVSVGGFLGIGSKLVAIPWEQFHLGQDNKLGLPGATKDALNAMPAFTYG